MAEKEFSFYDLFVPLTPKKIIVFLCIIGFVVFANSFYNPFIFDDIPQIVQNASVHTIYNIPALFVTSISLPHTSLPLLHIYYKPLLFSFYAILWTMFQGNPFGFHVFQTLLHITNSVLVFFLFKRFFKKSLAFFLSLIFLIHPIQSETVIYAANLQDILFVFFGLFAINIFLQTKKLFKPSYETIIISFFLLLSLFSKETGILFCGMALISNLFFQKSKKILTIVAIGIAFTIYLIFRFIASFSPTSNLTLSLMQKLPVSERLLSVPKIIWYYLSTFFLPMHLATGQAWIIKQTTFSDFWSSLSFDMLFFLILGVIGFTIFNYHQKLFSIFLFFTIWFLFGVLFHIQLIPLDLTVADRWFYFPIIGLLGIIGVVGQIVLLKLSITKQKIIMIHFICALFILGVLTILRNSQWQNPFTLYSHDITYAKDNPTFLSYYGGLLMDRGEYDKAKPYLDRSLQLDPFLGSNSINFGAWEEHANDLKKAQDIYQHMIMNKTTPSSFKQLAYENLTRVVLFKIKDIQQAQHIVQKGLYDYPHDQLLAAYYAIILYKGGKKQDAESLLEKFLDTSPNQQMITLLELIKHNALQFSH